MEGEEELRAKLAKASTPRGPFCGSAAATPQLPQPLAPRSPITRALLFMPPALQAVAKGKKQHDIFKKREADLAARVAELEQAAAAAAASTDAGPAPAAAAAAALPSALQEEVEELRAKLEKARWGCSWGSSLPWRQVSTCCSTCCWARGRRLPCLAHSQPPPAPLHIGCGQGAQAV